MIVALYILLALVAVGTVLYILHRRDLRKHGINPADDEPVEPQEECCGMHVTCERDSLLASVSTEIEYYDDEELDRFKGRGPEDYTDDEIEEFRDVLLTLLPTIPYTATPPRSTSMPGKKKKYPAATLPDTLSAHSA